MTRWGVALLATAALLLAACTDGARDAEDKPLTVFAAASLAAPFETLAAEQEVNFSFGGSSGLVDQLQGGAPADVFASADQRTMDRAVEAGVIAGEPSQFAENHLVLVTPADNPAGVTGLDDSLDAARLVVCAAEVPCGSATQRLAEANEVVLQAVSEELSVTDVLGKVTSGEADAGFVYRTDALGAGDAVAVIDLPGAAKDPNTYWIAAVKGGDLEGARKFIERVQGEGQEVLEAHGFAIQND